MITAKIVNILPTIISSTYYSYGKPVVHGGGRFHQWCFQVNNEGMLKFGVLNICSHESSETLNYQNVRAFFGRDMNSGSICMTIV